MTISLLKQYCIGCDECGEIRTSSHGDNDCWYRKSVIKRLRKEGWSVGNKVLCPKCKEELKQEIEK